jgi:hypothetical protein
MAPDEYSKALDKALSDLHGRVQQRDLLSAEIAGLRETVRVLSTLVQMPPEKQREVAKLLAMADYATPSLTDAIRSLLTRVSPKEMTAIEVRNALEDSSNSEDFSNSLSACHAALKRMLSDGEVELGPPKNGKATYRRVLKLELVGHGVMAILAGLTNLPGPSFAEELGTSSTGTTDKADTAQPVNKLAEGARFPKDPRPPNWKK